MPLLASVSMWINDARAFGERTAAATQLADEFKQVTEVEPLLQFDQVVALLGDARETVPLAGDVVSTYFPATAGAKFVGHRRVDLYCQGGYGEEEGLETIIRAINDCHAVFVAKIGGCPKSDLQKAGIEPVDQFAHEFIEKSAISWFKSYLDKVNSGEIEHIERGDAEIRQGALINAA